MFRFATTTGSTSLLGLFSCFRRAEAPATWRRRSRYGEYYSPIHIFMNGYCYALPATYNRHLPIIILLHKSHLSSNVFIILSYGGTLVWYGTVFVLIVSSKPPAMLRSIECSHLKKKILICSIGEIDMRGYFLHFFMQFNRKRPQLLERKVISIVVIEIFSFSFIRYVINNICKRLSSCFRSAQKDSQRSFQTQP